MINTLFCTPPYTAASPLPSVSAATRYPPGLPILGHPWGSPAPTGVSTCSQGTRGGWGAVTQTPASSSLGNPGPRPSLPSATPSSTARPAADSPYFQTRAKFLLSIIKVAPNPRRKNEAMLTNSSMLRNLVSTMTLASNSKNPAPGNGNATRGSPDPETLPVSWRNVDDQYILERRSS